MIRPTCRKYLEYHQQEIYVLTRRDGGKLQPYQDYSGNPWRMHGCLVERPVRQLVGMEQARHVAGVGLDGFEGA